MARFEERFPPQVTFGSRLLRTRRPAQRGTDVALLQILHNALRGLLDHPYGPAVAVDGIWGPDTETAVRALQLRFGLRADGIVGPATYFAFGHGVGAHTTYGGPAFGSRNLGEGASGGDVYVLQNRLSLYRYAEELAEAPNGVFGPSTAAALSGFKRDAQAAGDTGLGGDPEVDASTANALWLCTHAGGRAIFAGRNGLDVAFVQRLLKIGGLFSSAVDGRYGPAFADAVRAFQGRSALSVDGIVGPATFLALGRLNRHGAPHPLPAGAFWEAEYAPGEGKPGMP